MSGKTVTSTDYLTQETIYKKMIDEMEEYAIILLDLNGNIKSWNKGAKRIKGYDADEIIGKNFSVFYSENDLQKNLPAKLLAEAKDKGKVVTEGWRLKKNGEHIWVNSVITALHDEKSALIGFTKIIRDYTEKKKQDERSQFLSNIVINIHDPIITTDPAYLITDWNKAAEELLEWKKEEVIGKSTSEVLKASYLNVTRDEVVSAFNAKGFWQGEATFRSKSGKIKNVLVTASELRSKDGTITGSVVLAKDFTDRKKAEQELEKLNNELERKVRERTEEIFENNRRFQSLVENDFTITALLNEKFETIYRSPSAESILGWSDEERSNLTLEELTHPDDREKQKMIMKEMIANPGKPVNVTFRSLHKNGHYVWIEGTAVNRLQDKGINAFVINMHDITERKKSQEKNRENEEKYRLLIERISDGFIALDNNFRYTYVNKKISEITGYAPEYLVGKNVWEVFPDAVGSETYNAFHLAMKEQKYIYNVDYYEQLNLWQENHIYPSPDGLSIFIRDISERKRAEIVIRQLNESLEERVKIRTAELTAANKALESFSYMVSHDLQSPLRTLNGFTSIILEKYNATFDEDLKNMFTHIVNSSKRMNSIIDDLLKLAKYGNEKLTITTINMVDLFQKVWNNLTQNSTTKAEFELGLLPTIQGDESMMEQVIINLLSNAIKYSSKKEKPVIKVGYTDTNGTPRFFIKDNGIGFSMEQYDKLFGAFQRLHSSREYEGTGIGLLLVKRIIENHKGLIWAESKVDEGATFYFTIPETITKDPTVTP